MLSIYYFSDIRESSPPLQPWATFQARTLRQWDAEDRARIAALSIHDLQAWASAAMLSKGRHNLFYREADGERRTVPRDPYAIAPRRAQDASAGLSWALGWASPPPSVTTLQRSILGRLIRDIEKTRRAVFYVDERGRMRGRLVTKPSRNTGTDSRSKGVSEHRPRGLAETRRPRARQHLRQRLKKADGSHKLEALKDELELARIQKLDYKRRTTNPANLKRRELLPPRTREELPSYLVSRGLMILNTGPHSEDELAAQLERIAWSDALHTLKPDYQDIPAKTLYDAERVARAAARIALENHDPDYLAKVRERARKGGLKRTHTDADLASVAHLSKSKAAVALGCSESTIARSRKATNATLTAS